MGRPWPAHGLGSTSQSVRSNCTAQLGKPLFFEPVYCEIRLLMRSRLLRSLPVTIAEISPERWATPEIIPRQLPTIRELRRMAVKGPGNNE